MSPKLFGIAAAGAVVVVGIYLPMTEQEEWALLPFLLAFVPYALADVAAWFIQEREVGFRPIAAVRE